MGVKVIHKGRPTAAVHTCDLPVPIPDDYHHGHIVECDECGRRYEVELPHEVMDGKKVPHVGVDISLKRYVPMDPHLEAA